jgi:hypothetical protein
MARNVVEPAPTRSTRRSPAAAPFGMPEAPALVVPTQPTRREYVNDNVLCKFTNLVLQAFSAIFRSESWGCTTCSSWRSSPPQCSCEAGRAGRGGAAAACCRKLQKIMQSVLMNFCSILQRVLLEPSGRYYDFGAFVEAFAARSSAAAGSAGAPAAAAHVRAVPRGRCACAGPAGRSLSTTTVSQLTYGRRPEWEKTGKINGADSRGALSPLLGLVGTCRGDSRAPFPPECSGRHERTSLQHGRGSGPPQRRQVKSRVRRGGAPGKAPDRCG